MEIIEGKVSNYKGHGDIHRFYGKIGEEIKYYFLDFSPLSNGNMIATTELVEAIDSEVAASHIGVVDKEGNVIVPLENKSIKPITGDIILIEHLNSLSQNVIDAINASKDAKLATGLVSITNTCKNRVMEKLGGSSELVFHNQLSEASIFDINGNNLVNNEFYSFIGINGDKIYLGKNVEDAPVAEYSMLPPEVQANTIVEDNAVTNDIQVEQAVNTAADIMSGVDNTIVETANEVVDAVAPAEVVNDAVAPVETETVQETVVDNSFALPENTVQNVDVAVPVDPTAVVDAALVDAAPVANSDVSADEMFNTVNDTNENIEAAEGFVNVDIPIVDGMDNLVDSQVVEQAEVVAPVETEVVQDPVVDNGFALPESTTENVDATTEEVVAGDNALEQENVDIPVEVPVEDNTVVTEEADIAIPVEAPVETESEETDGGIDVAFANEGVDIPVAEGFDLPPVEEAVEATEAVVNDNLNVDDVLNSLFGGNEIETESEEEYNAEISNEEDNAEESEAVNEEENSEESDNETDEVEADNIIDEITDETDEDIVVPDAFEDVAVPETEEVSEEEETIESKDEDEEEEEKVEEKEDEPEEETKMPPFGFDNALFGMDFMNKDNEENVNTISSEEVSEVVNSSSDEENEEEVVNDKLEEKEEIHEEIDEPVYEKHDRYERHDNHYDKYDDVDGLFSEFNADKIESFEDKYSNALHDSYNDDYSNDYSYEPVEDKYSYDAYNSLSAYKNSNDDILSNAGKVMGSLISLNRKQRSDINRLSSDLDKANNNSRMKTEKIELLESKLDSASNKVRNLDTIVNKLESKTSMLSSKVDDQKRLIESQTRELNSKDREIEELRRQLQGKEELARFIADAQSLLGQNDY